MQGYQWVSPRQAAPAPYRGRKPQHRGAAMPPARSLPGHAGPQLWQAMPRGVGVGRHARGGKDVLPGDWLSDWRTARPFRKAPSGLQSRHERVGSHAREARSGRTSADGVDDQTSERVTPNTVAARLARFCVRLPRSRREWSTNAAADLQANGHDAGRSLTRFRRRRTQSNHARTHGSNERQSPRLPAQSANHE